MTLAEQHDLIRSREDFVAFVRALRKTYTTILIPGKIEAWTAFLKRLLRGSKIWTVITSTTAAPHQSDWTGRSRGTCLWAANCMSKHDVEEEVHDSGC
jgi:hypothetical protein